MPIIFDNESKLKLHFPIKKESHLNLVSKIKGDLLFLFPEMQLAKKILLRE
jgi:hypothetical protein